MSLKGILYKIGETALISGGVIASLGYISAQTGILYEARVNDSFATRVVAQQTAIPQPDFDSHMSESLLAKTIKDVSLEGAGTGVLVAVLGLCAMYPSKTSSMNRRGI